MTNGYAYAFQKLGVLFFSKKYKTPNDAEEVLKEMDKPQNYSVYRDRLARRGIVTLRQGYIRLSLPYFGSYIKEYHM